MRLTVRPETLRDRPPDWRNLSARSGRPLLALWITMLAVMLPAVAFFQAPPPRIELLPWWVELFSLPLAIVLGLALTIGWHELGHLAAAAAAGFNTVFVMVGPLQWTRTDAGWKLLHSGFGGLLAQGRVLALPSPGLRADRPALRRRMLWMYAGGPLATLMQAIILVALVFVIPPETLNQVERAILIALAMLSVLILAWTAVPLRMGELYSDMAQIRRLRRGGRHTERLLALLVLTAQSVDGVRARDLDDDMLAAATHLRDGSHEEIAGRLFAIGQAGDEGHIDRQAILLDDLLSRLRELPAGRWPTPALWEAATFEALLGKDPVAARGWLDLAGESRYPSVIEAQIGRLAAETAVALSENDLPSAAGKAHLVRKLLTLSYNKGGIIPLREWLDRMIADYSLDDPRPGPPPLGRLVWLPIARSVALTTLFVAVLSVLFFLIAGR